MGTSILRFFFEEPSANGTSTECESMPKESACMRINRSVEVITTTCVGLVSS